MDRQTDKEKPNPILSLSTSWGHLFLSVMTLQRFADSILISLGSTLLLASYPCQFADCLLTMYSTPLPDLSIALHISLY